MAALDAPTPGSAEAWRRAARPATLPASVAPVLVGTAVAVGQSGFRPLPALACLTGALLLQLGTNFVNDYADFEHGADEAGRLGPPRAAQSGWLPPRSLRRGAALAFAAAVFVGAYLVALGGWPIALGGALAVLAAWAYTSGPWPLGYHGLGDLLVFVFFGLFAVGGTHAVQVGAWSVAALLTAVPVGLLAAAILAVNNLRDLQTDAQAGKRTLAVRLGPTGARRYTAGLVVGAYASLAPLPFAGAPPLAALLPLTTLPLAAPVWIAIARASGPALNPVLGATARLELAVAAAMALGWWLG